MDDTESSGARKMSFEGASPIIFGLTLAYSLPIVLAAIFFNAYLRIQLIPSFVLIILGAALLCVGISLYIITLKKLTAGFKARQLIKQNVFSWCRNPLFATVIFLIVPGILLFFENWLLLTIPLFMYVMFKIFIRREEKVLEGVFGKEYVEYKQNVPSIVPAFGRLFTTRNSKPL